MSLNPFMKSNTMHLLFKNKMQPLLFMSRAIFDSMGLQAWKLKRTYAIFSTHYLGLVHYIGSH